LRRLGLAENLQLSRSRRLLLDTNAFIYFLTGLEPYFSLLTPLFERVQRRQAEVIASVITEAELLVRPSQQGDQEALERIAGLLSEDGISVLPVSRPTARSAAVLRARNGLKLPDAIIVATAVGAGCDLIVGNDGRWRRLTEVPYLHLEDVVSTA